MKNQIIFLLLLSSVLSILTQFVSAQETSVEVNVYTNGTVYFNTNINTSNPSYIYVNGDIANPVYQEIHTKTTNREGILKTVGDTVLMWTGDKKDSNPNKYELYLLNAFSRFATIIANNIYEREIRFLKLELEAQQKMNREYQRRFDNLYILLGANNNSVLNERSIECQAYIDLMAEGLVDKVTCYDRIGYQVWVADRNLSKAVRFNPPIKEVQQTNQSNQKLSFMILDQSKLVEQYNEWCEESKGLNYTKGITKYCESECDYGTSSDCICKYDKIKVMRLKQDGYYQFFCVR